LTDRIGSDFLKASQRRVIGLPYSRIMDDYGCHEVKNELAMTLDLDIFAGKRYPFLKDKSYYVLVYGINRDMDMI
jgi:hypothetical protein